MFGTRGFIVTIRTSNKILILILIISGKNYFSFFKEIE